jgi:hypothetical protein
VPIMWFFSLLMLAIHQSAFGVHTSGFSSRGSRGDKACRTENYEP